MANGLTLHIISFDVPFPPDYGGVIDVFYKLKALHSKGCKIILHCYDYGRGQQNELDKYCQKVYYYKRNMNVVHLLGKLPFIVQSRNSKNLLNNLLQDNYPILFEGLHSCYFLAHEKLRERYKIVRTHNIEHDYYSNLYKSENNILKRLYLKLESQKLKQFESVLKHANYIAAISENDTYHFRRQHQSVFTLSAFHSYNQVNIKSGKGTYALYHGNLAVAENNLAALYLVNEVFSKTNFRFIIAGNKPSAQLSEVVAKHSHIELRSNISTQEINVLIENAHINILPTFQATGIKLKLLSALYSGRYCLVNTPMVANTGLEELCIIKDSAKDMVNEIESLKHIEFNSAELQHRNSILNGKFSTEYNAQLLIDKLLDIK
ncbi:MAG: glycosyltransferase [Bacteroidia bacterium]|nr:glycosyltransferase [Bacteroidia bacterium]MCZ2249795.1 glycosyltransferase [Bacteroidia bacterium]